jgi:hypothetical protein
VEGTRGGEKGDQGGRPFIVLTGGHDRQKGSVPAEGREEGGEIRGVDGYLVVVPFFWGGVVW